MVSSGRYGVPDEIIEPLDIALDDIDTGTDEIEYHLAKFLFIVFI